ncbi:MAG: response regulator transcription factor [Actinomycetota bacterium]|nr:response regulator transcription factor [Actinomycetota bacterium]
MIRVVVVDDHLFYREGVRTLLGDFGDIEVTGEAARGDEVIDLLTQVQADVVLLDLGLPGRSGLALLPEIKLRWPRMAVVVVTMDDEDSSVRTALQRGAAGYLLKDASATELHRALTAAAEGQFTLSSSLTSRVPGLMGGREDRSPARGVPSLTPRERSIMELLAKGRSNDDIARSFGVSTKTVRNQLSLLYTKLAVSDRSQAVLLARDLGFG